MPHDTVDNNHPQHCAQYAIMHEHEMQSRVQDDGLARDEKDPADVVDTYANPIIGKVKVCD